jgi:hypothetical protein
MNDYAKRAPGKDVFTLRPYEKEDSFDSSMITVIVSLQASSFKIRGILAKNYFSTGRRHPLSSRFLLPPKRIGDIEGYHYHVQVRLNPPARRYRRRVHSLVEVLL